MPNLTLFVHASQVIKSCARLDYATAQNIIDRKVATGEDRASLDDNFWPRSRQPTGGHTHDQVAHDVRLMHRVAMARRRLRFQNGALALNGIKLAFKLEEDGETPQVRVLLVCLWIADSVHLLTLSCPDVRAVPNKGFEPPDRGVHAFSKFYKSCWRALR